MSNTFYILLAFGLTYAVLIVYALRLAGLWRRAARDAAPATREGI
jgi:hypothetical protein